MLDKSLYNTILCQTFSPCGKYLLAGNIYGQLAVFDLDRILNPIIEFITTEFNKPKQIHTIENAHQICSMVSTQKYLVMGTVSEICGWDWKSVLGPKLGKPSWVISPGSKQSNLGQLDVNTLWLSEDEDKIFAGCGDNNIYCFHLEDGRLISKYDKHTDYIHSIHGKGQQLISASEDGFVKLWDIRTGQCHNSVQPHANSNMARPEIGKWVGSVALSDDWFVCGGGPRAALWHLRSLDAVTTFNVPDRGIHVSYFHDDCIILGGSARHLYQVTYSGDVKVELPVSCTTVYSALIRTSPNKVLTVAGSSPDIDFCTTFNYRDQVLHFR